MATRDEIYREVITILVESFSLEEKTLAPKSRLMADLDLDSIDAIDLAVHLEDRLGDSPKGQDLRAMVTIDDIVRYIDERQHAGAAIAADPSVAREP